MTCFLLCFIQNVALSFEHQFDSAEQSNYLLTDKRSIKILYIAQDSEIYIYIYIFAVCGYEMDHKTFTFYYICFREFLKILKDPAK